MAHIRASSRSVVRREKRHTPQATQNSQRMNIRKDVLSQIEQTRQEMNEAEAAKRQKGREMTTTEEVEKTTQ